MSSFARTATQTVVDRKELFEGLLRTNYRQAYNLAYRLTGNAAEAEDLCQETFVRAYRFFHRFDESLPFTNWISRIMCNAHIDLVRRKGKLKTTSLDHSGVSGDTVMDIADYDAVPDRELLEGAMADHVQRSLDDMTAEFRTAVLLADVEGMAYEEIADVMGTSIGTVRSRIHRGRRQLRNFLMKRAPKLYGRLRSDV